MLDTIVQILKDAGVHAWEITDEKKQGWEFYFIRHALDQNRAKNVEHITVKVYQLIDGGEFMGSAASEIPPTASYEEAKAIIDGLSYRATLVKNRPYDLEPLSEAHKAPRDLTPADVPAIAGDFIRAMGQLPETATEDINSYEIFAASVTRRILTSTGIDVTEVYPSSMIEVVVNARKDGHEIELYRNYVSGTCDAAGLKDDLVRTMGYGKDRLVTSPTPLLGTVDVMFTTKDACDIYDFFVERLDPQMVFRKMSDWQLGTPIASEIQGDKVTVKAVRTLENSSSNFAFDAQGAPIRDTVMLEQSVPRAYLGGRMFSAYMGLTDSFIPSNIVVEGGSRSAAELRTGRYLEVVEFSDFQVDAMTGDIFGEIRLGYLHDGDKVTPVSGGSVSGSMRDFVKQMYLSRESVQYNNMKIPAVTLLKNVTVTGVGE
jgi:predicted Zn-dependent protease